MTMGPPLRRRQFLATAASGMAATSIIGSAKAAGIAIGAERDPDAHLTELTASTAARMIRAGELRSADLVAAFLRRIARYDGPINSLITVTRDAAMKDATACDQEARQGNFRGPLHGVPILLKDNIDTRGIRTTAASLVFANRVPAEDAEVFRRLHAAGAVLLGKTNMHEFAGGITSASSYFGPVHNPWQLNLDAGGSSSGSAAAISAGFACAAIGTDTGGSIRAPASHCGVVGLKPSYGLVPIRGIVPLVPSLDHCGPITRSVEDAALMLGVMAGYDTADITSVETPSVDYLTATRQSIGHIRLGLPRTPFFDALDPAIAAAIEAAIDVLKQVTAGTTEALLPDTGGFTALGTAEIEAYHQSLFAERPQEYGLHFRGVLRRDFDETNNVSNRPCVDKVTDYVRSVRELARLRRQSDAIFANCDVLVLPTMRKLPRELSTLLRQEEGSEVHEPQVLANATVFNVLGLPAISVPCGFSPGGLPIGLTIAGPRFNEARVLAVAQSYERLTRWQNRRPMLSHG